MVKIEFFPETSICSSTKSMNRNPRNYPVLLSDDPLLKLLLTEKQDFGGLQVAEPISLKDLLVDEVILKPPNFPKKEVLGEEFTEEDYRILCAKLTLQHEQFRKHQMRDIKDKIERIKTTFLRLTYEEIFTALKMFDFSEDEVTMYLTKNEFIAQIRNQIAQMRSKEPFILKSQSKQCSEPVKATSFNFEDADSLSEETDEEEDVKYRASDSRKKISGNSATGGSKQHVKKSSVPSNPQSKRLRLDDALANSAEMENWSEARIRAFQVMKKNPNAYFYRFNAPGETQKNGPWTKEEDSLFMRRLTEVGADGQWGIFSQTIPGRVGYQCSNYYRKLVEIGRIKDLNYRIDEKGKAHYIGGKTRATGKRTEHHDEDNDDDDDVEEDSCSEQEGEDSSEDGDELNEPIIVRHKGTAFSDIPRSQYNYENPLPGFIDAITRNELVRPAISPYGHVLSYETWLRCLLNGDRKNVCPLTNQPLHKRQLIFLTAENIEMYRDRIRQDK